MKLGTVLFGAVAAWSGVKEHIMIEQYLRTGDVSLVDDDRKAGKRQWHDCGEKPKQPDNALSVECQGPFCATVCKQGESSKHVVLCYFTIIIKDTGQSEIGVQSALKRRSSMHSIVN